MRFERGTVRIDASSGTAEVVDFERGSRHIEACGSTDYAGRFREVNRNFTLAAIGMDSSYLEEGDLLLNTESAIALSESGSWSSFPT